MNNGDNLQNSGSVVVPVSPQGVPELRRVDTMAHRLGGEETPLVQPQAAQPISKAKVFFSFVNVFLFAFVVAFNFAILSYKRAKGDKPLGVLLFLSSFLINLPAAIQVAYRSWVRFTEIQKRYDAVVYRMNLDNAHWMQRLGALLLQEKFYIGSLIFGGVGGVVTVPPSIPFSDEGLRLISFFKEHALARNILNGESGFNVFICRFLGVVVTSNEIYQKIGMSKFQPEFHFVLNQVLPDVKRFKDCWPKKAADTVVAVESLETNITDDTIRRFYNAIKANYSVEDRAESVKKTGVLTYFQLGMAAFAVAVMLALFYSLDGKGTKMMGVAASMWRTMFVGLGTGVTSLFYGLFSYRFLQYMGRFLREYPVIMGRVMGPAAAQLSMIALTIGVLGSALLSGAGYAQAGDEFIQSLVNSTVNPPVASNGTAANSGFLLNNTANMTANNNGTEVSGFLLAMATPVPFFGSVYGLLCMLVAGMLVNGGMVQSLLLGFSDEFKRFDDAGVTQSFCKIVIEYLFHCLDLGRLLPAEVKEQEKVIESLQTGRVRINDLDALKAARAEAIPQEKPEEKPTWCSWFRAELSQDVSTQRLSSDDDREECFANNV